MEDAYILVIKEGTRLMYCEMLSGLQGHTELFIYEKETD